MYLLEIICCYNRILKSLKVSVDSAGDDQKNDGQTTLGFGNSTHVGLFETQE